MHSLQSVLLKHHGVSSSRGVIMKPYVMLTLPNDSLQGTLKTTPNDYGIMSASGAYIIAPVDANALAFGRSPKHVLPIVYLGGTAFGGFFPNGKQPTGSHPHICNFRGA